MTIGRNEFCPCGSGRKYKKCCLRNRAGEGVADVHIQVSRIVRWAISKWATEFRLFAGGYDIARPEVAALLAHTFVFEHRLPNGLTPLDSFLGDASLTEEELNRCTQLRRQLFSIFEVTGLEEDRMVLKDILHEGTYTVYETSMTEQSDPAELLLCMIAPWEGRWYVISPAGFHLSVEAKRHFDTVLNGHSQYDRLQMKDCLPLMMEKEGAVDHKERLRFKAQQIGLKLDFRTLEKRVRDHVDIQRAFPEVFHFRYQSNEDFKEVMELLIVVWNEYREKMLEGSGIKRAGPQETQQIIQLTKHITRQINPAGYPSRTEFEAAEAESRKKWLQTPQTALCGKTPAQIILEERKRLGNTNTEIAYQMQVAELPDFSAREAERLYEEGQQAYRQGLVEKAAQLYRSSADICPENYKAWGNAGISFALAGNRQEGIRCLEKALEINPRYMIARSNLNVVKKDRTGFLALQGVTGALMRQMKDNELRKQGLDKRKREKALENIDVWKDIVAVGDGK